MTPQTTRSHSLEAAPAGVERDADLSRLHTLGLACRAWAFGEAASPEHLVEMIAWAEGEGKPWRLIGGGSNILFAKERVDALIVRLGRQFSRAEVDAERSVVVCGARANWPSAIKAARDAGFGGLEYGLCIPGTIGGALAGNAGAAGRAVCEDAVRVFAMNKRGEPKTFHAGEFAFSYRHSELAEWLILGAELRVAPTPAEVVDRRMADMRDMRHAQPKNVHSSGCFFRNPPGGHAGRLIDECGLKGSAVGPAAVSEIHANFLVNQGGATPAELLELMERTRRAVERRTGVLLEPEVRVVDY